MRRYCFFLLIAVLARAETISGSKTLSGGTGTTAGSVSLDGNQSFGAESLTFRAVVFPGLHTLSSNAPFGYSVSYSVCVNCTDHPVSSFVAGTSVPVVVPINGSVDVMWLYAANPGIVQISRVLPNGSLFLNAGITIDGSQKVPAGNALFSGSFSATDHSVLSDAPPGYAVTFSVCINCTQHLSASYQQGYLVLAAVPPSGFIDISFLYTPLPPATISVTSPAPNQTISGTLTLAVSGGNLSKAASVEYAIGSNRIARVAAQVANPTFQTAWNSALAADGNSQIEVTVRDAVDAILFQDVRPVVVSNYGNSASVSLPGTFTGSVPLTLTAFDKVHFPAYWQVFLDGEIGPNSSGLLFSDHDAVHSNSRSTILDSTAYPNGRHEFHFAFHSNDYPVTNTSLPGLDFRGMVTQNVNLDNGRALMEIVPNYLFVYTSVGTGVQLACNRAYTNLDRDACLAPSYAVNAQSSSPGVQVTSGGLVSGSQEGYGDITVSEAGKSATVHVWIRNTSGLPHFQDAGNYGTTYGAGKSLFVIAPFQLAPDLLQSDASLFTETKRAGVNTLNKGVFLPNNNASLPFSTWKQNYDSSAYASLWSWSFSNGFRVLGSGDDITRRPGWEGSWISKWPAAPQAVSYAMQTFAQSGAGLSLDVVDESSAQWGSNPTPNGLVATPNSLQSATCSGAQCFFTWPSLTDPLDYTLHDPLLPNHTFLMTGESRLAGVNTITSAAGTQINFAIPSAAAFAQTQTLNAATSPNLEYLWFSGSASCAGNVMCNPALPNNLLSSIAGWLRSATARVPISWPPAGSALPYVHRNWMKPGGISDYASHYWDSNQQRRTYPFGMGIRENQNSMLSAFLGRQMYVDISRPQLLEQSMAGIDYLKYSAAGNAAFTPPVDLMLHVGTVPKAVSSGIFTAAAAGAAGVKLYKVDTSYAQRRDNRGDGTEFESDAGPATGETLNWQAMGYAAATLSKSLQEYLLGTPVSSPNLGRNINTAVRQGASGNLLMVVNGWDATRTVSVDLSPYRTGNIVLRYRVADTSIRLQNIGDVAGETLTLASGEAAIYLLPKTSTPAGLDTVAFTPDTPNTRTVLRTNYLYSQNTAAFGDPVDCSAACTVKIDRRLGEAFYSYVVLDAAGVVQCRSAATAVPAANSVSLAVGAQTRGAVCQ